MKAIKHIILLALIAAMAVSCEDYLDPINPVSPKTDQNPPEVVINYPVEGKPFVSPDPVATITFKAVASDDIELKSVIVTLDGTEIANYTTFKDYRRMAVELNYDLGEGEHTLTVAATDLTGKDDSQSVTFKKITAPVYNPLDGEVLYLPLDGYYLDLISGNAMTVNGTPGFIEGKVNDAYAGAPEAYMEYPVTGMLSSEFSVAFWYKINAEPLRGGILSISPEGDDRTKGLRMFHENSGNFQNIGLNFGIGEAEVWMNPFIQIDPAADWIHIALSISTSHATIYVDGEVVLEQDIDAKIDWTGCSPISIASGAPNFTYWEHFSDNSLYDEIHMFNKAISADVVQGLYNVKK